MSTVVRSPAILSRVPSPAFFVEIIHNLVFFLRVLLVLDRLRVVLNRQLHLASTCIALRDPQIGPRILRISTQGLIETFHGLFPVTPIEQHPAEGRMSRRQV